LTRAFLPKRTRDLLWLCSPTGLTGSPMSTEGLAPQVAATTSRPARRRLRPTPPLLAPYRGGAARRSPPQPPRLRPVADPLSFKPFPLLEEASQGSSSPPKAPDLLPEPRGPVEEEEAEAAPFCPPPTPRLFPAAAPDSWHPLFGCHSHLLPPLLLPPAAVSARVMADDPGCGCNIERGKEQALPCTHSFEAACPVGLHEAVTDKEGTPTTCSTCSLCLCGSDDTGDSNDSESPQKTWLMSFTAAVQQALEEGSGERVQGSAFGTSSTLSLANTTALNFLRAPSACSTRASTPGHCLRDHSQDSY